MQIITDISKYDKIPCSATIGSFDGVHQGHLAMLGELREAASLKGLPLMVVTFATTVAAMEMERYCLDHGIPGRLIPTPRQITADCGLSWSAPPEAEEAIYQAAKDGNIEIAGSFTLMI